MTTLLTLTTQQSHQAPALSKLDANLSMTMMAGRSALSPIPDCSQNRGAGNPACYDPVGAEKSSGDSSAVCA